MSTESNVSASWRFNRLFAPGKFLTLKNRPYVFGIATFLILAGLIFLLVYQRFLSRKENKTLATKEYVTAVKERLQQVMAKSVVATNTLSFFIQPNGTVTGFEGVAAQLLKDNPNIAALQMAPKGVIQLVYPLEGNNSVIGYDVLNDPHRRTEAIKAIEHRDFYFAGPFQLKQGGLGVVGRLPVFIKDEFWGFSAVIIKIPRLIQTAGIDTLGKKGFYFQLSKLNPQSGEEEVFITPRGGKLVGNVISVTVPQADWKLSAAPVDSTSGYADIFWLGLLGLLFSIMGGIFVYTVTRSPERLKTLVKRRTSELAESEQRYRSLIELASDGIIVYSFDGTIYHFNKRAYLETGYTKEEFATLNLKDLLASKKLTMRQEKADALQSGKSAMIERQLIRKDGSLMDIEINVSMLPDTNLLAFVRNITERKNAERALKESEQKFSRVFQSELMGVAIINKDSVFIDVNENYAAMLGSTRQNLIGKVASTTLFSSTTNEVAIVQIGDSVKNLLGKNGFVKNMEVVFEKNDGTTVCLLLSIVPLELNNLQHWLITTIDITDKKNAELAMLKSETKYRSLIEQASDGIVISDQQAIILEVNNSICRMTGYTSEELVGRSVNEFMPKEDTILHPLRIADLMEGKTLLYERRLQKKSGEIIDVEVNSSMAGENAFIGFVRDITERKKAAEELKLSDDRFDMIAKATNDAIWHHDFITDETTGNENLYKLYGFTKGIDTIHYDTFLERVHPEDGQRLVDNLQKLIEQKGSSIAEEFRFKVTDGSFRHIYDRAFVIYNNVGLPLKIMGVMQDITQRVNSEQAILKEKELSDSIINSLPAVFYLYNEAGKFLRWNSNFESVTGYNSAEIAAMHPLQVLDDKKSSEEKIREVFVNGQSVLETNLVTKNQEKIPYYFSGMRIDYEGECCLMGFGLDFTHKIKAQQAIKESEQKFRSLVEEASDAVTIVSPEGKVSYISPAVERILGYTEQEILAINIFDIIHPHSISNVKKLFAEAMQQPGVPVKGATCRILHKEGTWRWLEKTVTDMHHIPSINGLVENFRDVTQKLEIEKNIIAEKELSDSLINNLPGIFYLCDQTGMFIRWNDNFESITGYNAEEIKKMHPLDIFDDPDKTLLEARMKTIFHQKVPGVELLLVTKENQKLPIYYNSIAVEYKGTPCIMGMGFDVTDRKKVEQELLVSNLQLETKAAELITSYSELERFAYIVSHDLQEPLRMVSSFLTLLGKKYKDQLDETGEKYIYYAVDGAERMKQLITDLLEYSRTGTNKDVAADTDMNELVSEVLKVLKSSIEEEDAVIEVASLPVLPNTSKLQMFQLMQNLIGNALKYRGESTPYIKIGVTEEATHWLFSVTDNGIGIDPKYAEKVFIIFQRLHNKGEFSGTGIGLSICKKIVEKHGGRIWVDSNAGQGSTFYFTINKSQ